MFISIETKKQFVIVVRGASGTLALRRFIKRIF